MNVASWSWMATGASRTLGSCLAAPRCCQLGRTHGARCAAQQAARLPVCRWKPCAPHRVLRLDDHHSHLVHKCKSLAETRHELVSQDARENAQDATLCKRGFLESHASVGVSDKQEWATCTSAAPVPPVATTATPPATPPAAAPPAPGKLRYESWLSGALAQRAHPINATAASSPTQDLLRGIATDLSRAARARTLAVAGAAEAGCITEARPPQASAAVFAACAPAAPDLETWLAAHVRPPPGGALPGPPEAVASGSPKTAARVLRFLQEKSAPRHVAARALQQAGLAWRASKHDADLGAVLRDGAIY